MLNFSHVTHLLSPSRRESLPADPAAIAPAAAPAVLSAAPDSVAASAAPALQAVLGEISIDLPHER